MIDCTPAMSSLIPYSVPWAEARLVGIVWNPSACRSGVTRSQSELSCQAPGTRIMVGFLGTEAEEDMVGDDWMVFGVGVEEVQVAEKG